MKALTVCQPWAWMIVHGPKRYENRTWYTRYRGPLLIHAGKSRRWLLDDYELDLYRSEGIAIPHNNDLVYGALIGKCTLAGCYPYNDVKGQDWALGPWCWKLADVRPLDEPVPSYRGAPGLFEVPDLVLETPEQKR